MDVGLHRVRPLAVRFGVHRVRPLAVRFGVHRAARLAVRFGVRRAARLAVGGLAVCLLLVTVAGVTGSRDTVRTIAQAERETRLSSSYSNVMGTFLAVDRARRSPAGRDPRSIPYRRARAELDRAVEQVRVNGRNQDRALASYIAIEARRFDRHGRSADWDTLEILVLAAAEVHRRHADDALRQLSERRQRQASFIPWLIGVTGTFLAACTVLLLLLQRQVQRQADEQRHRAEHDELTGLANRAGFLHGLEKAVARTRRGTGTVTVLLIDLDDFKPVNDRWGHEAGDLVLRGAAVRLRSGLRAGDVAARLGGDEFGAVLPDLAAADRDGLVARLREQLAEPYLVEGRPVRSPASIGAVTAHGGAASAEELLREADLAMYREKHHRKAGRPTESPPAPRPDAAPATRFRTTA